MQFGCEIVNRIFTVLLYTTAAENVFYFPKNFVKIKKAGRVRPGSTVLTPTFQTDEALRTKGQRYC